MSKKVFSIDTKPGIQRDGTVLDKEFYHDGKWCRFQRGRPRKILGYREITGSMAGPSRGLYLNPQNNFNYVFNGYSDGLQVIPISNLGVGSGISDFTMSGFTPAVDNLWQFDTFFDTSGNGVESLVAHPSKSLSDVASSANTPVLMGDISGTTMAPISQFVVNASFASGATTITLAAVNNSVAAGQTITGAGIAAGTTVVSVATTTVTISLATTAIGTATPITFDSNISVSGGVVVLHPYVFVYGNNGLIKNCSAGDPTNWSSADSNENNVAGSKIVQGLPVRGGSNSPSGLFWSLDSLVRVSYNPTTVTTGTTSSTFYWRYDIISSQSSILSSQSAIEYDGIYYWCGVDRFLLYNGVVKEIPNNMNQNYFFDNLNYDQRQKVYVTKVPRFGEIWWFYPRGNSIECNDAIIYNVREQTWYDAGQAMGARRSAGYFSQVFHYPINMASEVNTVGGINLFTKTNGGFSYTNGTYIATSLTGGTGTGAKATIVVAGNTVTSITITSRGKNYLVGDTLSATLPAGSGLVITVNSLMNFVSMWQHEFGTDEYKNSREVAIESYFETNDLGLVSGGPSQPAPEGFNNWLHLERIEPDFIQEGELSLYIIGRPYAQSDDQISQPYVFDASTGKIDMREQRRELRIRVVSNVSGGNYQLGKLLLSADIGDVRGY